MGQKNLPGSPAQSRAVHFSSLPYIAGAVVLSYGHRQEVSRTRAARIFLAASSTALGGAPVNHHGSSGPLRALSVGI